MIEHRVLVLQNLLNTLFNNFIDWDFEVNVEKTKQKCLFRNAGKARNEETWSFDSKIIEVVDQFEYLGIHVHVLLNFNAIFFFTTQKQLASQGCFEILRE